MLNIASGAVVPFGKYKGQPVEVLAADRDYCEWLAGQPWFRERFATLYQTVIVNNFGEPSDTPEHNALQALFLDEEYRFAFLVVVGFDDKVRAKFNIQFSAAKHDTVRDLKEKRQKLKWGIETEERMLNLHCEKRPAARDDLAFLAELVRDGCHQDTWHAWLAFHEKMPSGTLYYRHDYERLVKNADEDGAVERECRKKIAAMLAEREKLDAVEIYDTPRNPVVGSDVEFEKDGVDVLLEGYKYAAVSNDGDRAYAHLDFAIELKPVVADDYPAVLRQMKRNGSRHLFLERYDGVGATEQQFTQIFKRSGIDVVFRRDVDRVLAEMKEGDVER